MTLVIFFAPQGCRIDFDLDFEARIAIPCETVDDSSPELRFRARLSPILARIDFDLDFEARIAIPYETVADSSPEL